MATREKVDLNTIPYDAPLSFPQPSGRWTGSQCRKGSNGKTLTVPPADLTGKNVLITGGNNGIGREAALQFAEWGANIWIGCRPNCPPHEVQPDDAVAECKKKAEDAGKKITVDWMPVDFSSVESVLAFGKAWNDLGKPLDILCNNAGMGSSPGGSEVFRTKDGFEIIHQVNFLSHVLLTLTILPSVAKAKTPRIVCTTSCFHFYGKYDLRNFNAEMGDPGHDGVQYYQNNKLWYQTWLTELQHRLLLIPEYKHITVNGAHPGYVNSGIWNMNKPSPWKQWLLQGIAGWLGITPQQGSLCILHAATALDCGPDPKTQGVGIEGGKGGGRYFNRIEEDEPMPHTKDPDFRMRVWRKCNDELGLQEKGLLDVVGLKYME